MAAPFDTLAAAEALENAGMDRKQARACAAQLQAAASAGEPVTRPELEAALAALETRLTDRIGAVETGQAALETRVMDRIGAVETGQAALETRIMERMAALVWRLFGGMAALVGLAVAALKYLP